MGGPNTPGGRAFLSQLRLQEAIVGAGSALALGSVWLLFRAPNPGPPPPRFTVAAAMAINEATPIEYVEEGAPPKQTLQ